MLSVNAFGSDLPLPSLISGRVGGGLSGGGGRKSILIGISSGLVFPPEKFGIGTKSKESCNKSKI